MCLLLTVASLISALGTTHAFFGRRHPENPEATMNVSQIISYWGYPSEEYEVVTEDGYFLEIYRIPYGKENAKNRGQRPVVLLQHGLLTTATNWIANLPNNSLGFLLADAGYDVWLANSRGSTWAKRHIRYSTDSAEFWAFSFDEMGKYDIPATLDFILKKTGQEKLHYVGHSQGTSIGFIAFSTYPNLAKRIKAFYALAPTTALKYFKSPLRIFTHMPLFLLKIALGDKAFSPHHYFIDILANEVCTREKLKAICSNAIFLLLGFDPKNLNMTRLDVYVSHNPAGTSVQNMLHWIQAVKSDKFQAFDWGNPVQNMRHYHQPTPPEYHLTDMNVPIAVWSGDNDLVADPHDVDRLLPKLPKLIYHKRIPSYNHMDFVWAMNAPQEVYNEIVSMMEKDKN
ncbi:gastric triacylglycerol lipase-like [Molossus nigricans]